MRMMLKVTIPAAKGSEAAQDGSMQRTIEATMDRLKPESAYFALSDGQRMAQFVFDLESTVIIPMILEPIWAALDADVELQPVTTYEELGKALEGVG